MSILPATPTDYFIWGLLVTAGLAVLLGLLVYFKKARIPNILFPLLLLVAIVQLMLVNRLKSTGNEQFRLELQELAPRAIPQVALQTDLGRRKVTSPDEIAALFSQLRRVEAVSAHHSSPINAVELDFSCAGRHYGYRIAQDSKIPDEYWVLETARAGEPGREIGRVESAELGRLLKALAAGPPATKP